jgi:hypothetical protein
MRQTTYSGILLGVFLAMAGDVLAEGILNTEGALFQSESAQGWTAGVRVDIARRELISEGEILDVELLRTTARFGVRVIPPVHCFVEGGWSKASLPQDEGEGGLTFTYGVDVAIWEHVLEQSPVLGNVSSLSLILTASRQSVESNIGSRDFSWDETVVSPTVRYTVNHMGDSRWVPCRPAHVSIYAGLAYSDLDGTLGDEAVMGNRDFGFVAGVDWKFFDSWIIGFSGTFFGDNDRTVGVGARWNF